jgi:hypothetical protein
MKYTKIALACSFALSAMAAQAAVVDIPAGTVTIYVSGATAPDNFFADTVSSMMSNVTAIRGITNANAYRAFLGTSNGVAGVADGTNILLIKRSKGGSVWGVNPVARSTNIETLDFNNCTALTGGAFQWECGVRGSDEGGTEGLVPDFGISDVEPAMFQGLNLVPGDTALSAAEVASLTSQPINAIAMGIVATSAVPATTAISRAQYGAMLAGKLNTWEQVDGSTDPVIVCRRHDGSGTQTSYNWFFSGFPCNSASNGFVENSPASTAGQTDLIIGGEGTAALPLLVDPTLGQAVIVENSGSGDVRQCLTAANNRTDFTRVDSNGESYTYQFSKLTAPGKAIGVLSLDSYASSNFTGASFRHLEGAGVFDAAAQTSSAGATGIAPSKDNIVNGRYDFVVELAGNSRATTIGEKKAFWDVLVRNLGSTRYTGNAGGTFTTVPNAFATLPTSASYDDEPALVSKYTRGANTCSPLQWRPSL